MLQNRVISKPIELHSKKSCYRKICGTGCGCTFNWGTNILYSEPVIVSEYRSLDLSYTPLHFAPFSRLILLIAANFASLRRGLLQGVRSIYGPPHSRDIIVSQLLPNFGVWREEMMEIRTRMRSILQFLAFGRF